MNGRITRRNSTEQQRLAIPRVGTIKIGYKDERGLPKSTDHFIASGKYASLFTQAYGDTPDTIQIVFPSDLPEQVCNERYEYRDNDGRLLSVGDGETFRVWDGKEYRIMTVSEYPNLMDAVARRYPNRQLRATGDGWSIILTLNFIIPLVRGVVGVWQLNTKGAASTIPNIRNVFDAMMEAKGYVKGIIFDLSVHFAKSNKPGDMSRYPVISLVPNESEQNINLVKQAYQPISIEKK